MSEIITPQNVESRLIQLSDELNEASQELMDSETVYYMTKATYEVKLAQKRLEIAGEYKGTKTTVQERDDIALCALEDYAMEIAAATALVKASKSNVERIKFQIDIARSLGTSVRSSYDAL